MQKVEFVEVLLKEENCKRPIGIKQTSLREKL